jgi:methyltransferase (TIGR00027 family)
METLINDVSDTALWVAAFRAIESERKDALFNDQWARRLAGDKGFKLVAATPSRFGKIMRFVMAIRTVAIDKLIHKAISLGIDTVINLGAGLDTRPYRMDLPTSLHWIEVDFPGIISYKTEAMKQEKPRCQLKRIAVDLSKTAQRDKLFSQLAAETKNALIITEGVIYYLSPEDAAELSRAIFSVPSFQFWIQDYRQGEQAIRRHPQAVTKMLANAPMKFTELHPLDFFGRHGWRVNTLIHMLDEGVLNHRTFPIPFPWNFFLPLSRKIFESINQAYGYVMFEKKIVGQSDEPGASA